MFCVKHACGARVIYPGDLTTRFTDGDRTPQTEAVAHTSPHVAGQTRPDAWPATRRYGRLAQFESANRRLIRVQRLDAPTRQSTEVSLKARDQHARVALG